MKKDLKNVSMTFGLVFATTVAGSFGYAAVVRGSDAKEVQIQQAQARIEAARAELEAKFATERATLAKEEADRLFI